MSVNSKMTAIADKIRSLLGINGKLGLDAMDTNLESANTEVLTQEELMAEIREVLAEKSANTSGAKPEQEKTVDITENGTTEVIPDSGKVLSKVTVNVEVESGGGSGEEFVGIKYSDFDSYRGSPRVADARNLPDQSKDSAALYGGYSYLFANSSKNGNGGWNALLEEIYISKLYRIGLSMFENCGQLKTIHGDVTNVDYVMTRAFYYCEKLTEFPYLPNLQGIQNNAFAYCNGLTEVKLYTKLSEFNKFAFEHCTNIKDIYVPWAEGEVANSPWGATNSTIHYNTVYDENHNPIV